jgi:transcriptional regulator with XRE-family HTH domain
MTEYTPSDGQIDQLVKAGWLAIGLSQADLAEVLDVALQQPPEDGNGPNGIDRARLMQIAEALGIPFELFCHRRPASAGQQEGELASAPGLDSLQSFLGLRLLRAFYELRDHRTKRMLVHLAEQIVKRQNNHGGDAS